MRAEIALINEGAALGPTDVVSGSGAMIIAGRALQVHLEARAVTAGDVWVFDPKTRVLLAGNPATLPAPFFESACPMRKREFTVYRRAFSQLLACAVGGARNDVCVDGWNNEAAL